MRSTFSAATSQRWFFSFSSVLFPFFFHSRLNQCSNSNRNRTRTLWTTWCHRPKSSFEAKTDSTLSTSLCPSRKKLCSQNWFLDLAFSSDSKRACLTLLPPFFPLPTGKTTRENAHDDTGRVQQFHSEPERAYRLSLKRNLPRPQSLTRLFLSCLVLSCSLLTSLSLNKQKGNLLMRAQLDCKDDSLSGPSKTFDIKTRATREWRHLFPKKNMVSPFPFSSSRSLCFVLSFITNDALLNTRQTLLPFLFCSFFLFVSAVVTSARAGPPPSKKLRNLSFLRARVLRHSPRRSPQVRPPGSHWQNGWHLRGLSQPLFDARLRVPDECLRASFGLQSKKPKTKNPKPKTNLTKDEIDRCLCYNSNTSDLLFDTSVSLLHMILDTVSLLLSPPFVLLSAGTSHKPLVPLHRSPKIFHTPPCALWSIQCSASDTGESMSKRILTICTPPSSSLHFSSLSSLAFEPRHD